MQGSKETNNRPGGQRIAGLSDRDAPLWLRVLYGVQRRVYGAVLEPTRVWARAPAAMRGFLHMYAAVDRRSSPLAPDLRSVVMIKVSQINHCSFCIDVNTSLLHKRSASLEKAAAVATYETSAMFTPEERAALDYAVAMSRSDATVDDALFARLRDSFDDDAIVELTALVALQNASSKFNAALGIPAQGLCAASRG